MKYSTTTPQRSASGRWLWRVCALVVMIVSLVCSGVAHYYKTTPTSPVAAAAPTTTSVGASSKLLFLGDVFWGRYMQTTAAASGLGTQYITHGLTAADRAQYDAWIANFECPITTHDIAYSLQVSALKFNCRPEYLPELARWFTAATLANNHMDNNGGQDGLLQTRRNLTQQGIQYFGNYDMQKTDDICEVVSLPATTTGRHQKVQLPVALCGYMYVVDATPSEAQLAVMQRYARVMPVIAMPHMGIEYRATAEAAKVSAYRRMIDHGADAVIGAHPHVIQNSESYKGHLIAYSLGNFLFDQQSLGRPTTLGLGVSLDLTVPAGRAAAAYSRLAGGCAQYKDDCLTKLQAAIPHRPSITVQYHFTCYNQASGVPRLGSAADCQEAQQAATVNQLSNLSTTW